MPLIALWPLIVRADDPRWWAAVVAGCLLLPAAVFPRSLTWIFKGWMSLGHVLGWINTRIILGFIFYSRDPGWIYQAVAGQYPMGRRLDRPRTVIECPLPPAAIASNEAVFRCARRGKSLGGDIICDMAQAHGPCRTMTILGYDG